MILIGSFAAAPIFFGANALLEDVGGDRDIHEDDIESEVLFYQGLLEALLDEVEWGYVFLSCYRRLL
jgi:hypothetical protein